MPAPFVAAVFLAGAFFAGLAARPAADLVALAFFVAAFFAGAAFVAAVFAGAAFFAGALVASAFCSGALFFAVVFFAGALVAAAFCSGAFFFAVVFFAGAFFAAVFFAVVLFAAVFFVVVSAVFDAEAAVDFRPVVADPPVVFFGASWGHVNLDSLFCQRRQHHACAARGEPRVADRDCHVLVCDLPGGPPLTEHRLDRVVAELTWQRLRRCSARRHA